jgi:hypothetical protein
MYQSYLLRLWQDSPHSLWRASAQSINTHEIVYFADLDTLFTFLTAQTIPAQRELPPCNSSSRLDPFSSADDKP